MKTFLNISLEILLDIAKYIDSVSLQNLCLTCRHVKEELVYDDKFWKILCQNEGFIRDDLFIFSVIAGITQTRFKRYTFFPSFS